MRDPNHNYKTNPSPPGPPGPDLSNYVSAEIALRTLQHAVEYNRKKWQEVELRCAELVLEMAELKKLEEQLDPFTVEGPLRMRHSLRDSLYLLAELFVNKYPNEDHEVVRNLVEMFVAPVEKKFEGDPNEPVPFDAPPK